MSAKGNRTIVFVDGKESYETIKESFGEVFQEISSLISMSKINVEGCDINIECLLGEIINLFY